MKFSGYLAIAAVMLFVSAGFCENGYVSQIVGQMPVSNSAKADELVSKIIEGGPNSIGAVCDMLVEPNKGDDSKARYAIWGMTTYVNFEGREPKRKMYVSELLKEVHKPVGKEVKAFLISQLQLAGRDDAVEGLSGFLSDEKLCGPATRALIQIGSKKAEKAFLNALPATKEKAATVAIIDALGQLKSKGAVKMILPLAQSNDVEIRMASLYAIANIGDCTTGEVLKKAAQANDGYQKSQAMSFYLLYAKRLVEEGQEDKAANICREIIETNSPSNVKSGALSVLVDAVEEDAMDELLAAVDSNDMEYCCAGLEFAGKIEGKSATKKWVEKLGTAKPMVQAKIVAMLGQRGDKHASSAIEKMLFDKDTSKEVKLECITALAKLEGKDAVEILLGYLKQASQKDEIEAVSKTLLCISGSEVVEETAKSLNEVTAESKPALIRVLSQRKAVQHLDLIFQQTDDNDSAVRMAAINAVGELAAERDVTKVIDVLFNAKSEAEKFAAQKAVTDVLNKITAPEKRAEPLLALIPKVSKEQKITVLKVLPLTGGKNALKAVESQLGSDISDIRDAAIRGLADWPTPDAVEQLANIAENDKELKNRVVALRGWMRLTGKADWQDEKKIEMYKRALKVAGRAEDKRLVLAGLSDIKTIESLLLVNTMLDDANVRSEAAMAAVKIACPEGKKGQGLSGYEVKLALEKANGLIMDEKVKEQIKEHLLRITAVPAGFEPLFNGVDLTGWKRHENLPGHGVAGKWYVEDGAIVGVQDPPGKGGFLTTERNFRDFELEFETKIDWPFDSGVFLRTGPDGKSHQVTLDYRDGGEMGAIFIPWPGMKFVRHCRDGINYFRKDGWNKIRIMCIGEPARITVWINETIVTDFQHTKETTAQLPQEGGISLQVHPGGKGFDESKARFRNIYVKEIKMRKNEADLNDIEAAEGFVPLFNGVDTSGWKAISNGGVYLVKNKTLIFDHTKNIGADGRSISDLFTEKSYRDFVLRFDFKLTDGANNGIGIHVPMGGHAAYDGWECQVLDDSAKKWKELKDYQYHGSVYGIVPAKKGHLKPVGEWNSEEIMTKGTMVKVILNGTTIVDANLADAKPLDGHEHPGLSRKDGHIVLLGHDSTVEFKNMRIKELD